MYDEMVKRLRSCSYSDPNGCEEYRNCPNADNFYECKQKLALQAADAIEELICEVAEEHNMRLDAEERQRWIPVTERLPEKYGTFITAYSKGGVSQNWYMTFHHGGGKWYQNSEDTGEVTHWMPLPEPPKEE